ncbi:hypothetical protein JCM10213v2_002180 [Rhodosporidiobolus nylandii]
MNRSASGKTLLLLGRDEAEGIGLGLPGALRPRTWAGDGGEDEDVTPVARRRASISSPSSRAGDEAESGPVPLTLTLPAAPHVLSAAELLSLPPSHLAALAQSLSRDLSGSIIATEEKDAELVALEKLAEEKGASRGERERARVRARAEVRERRGGGDASEEQEGGVKREAKLRRRSRDKGKRREGEKREEWTIEMGEFATPVAEQDSSEEEEEAEAAEVEVSLDLDDLTEAISSNAFDLGLQPTSPSSLHFPSSSRASTTSAAAAAADNDGSSTRSRAQSLPFPPTSAAAVEDDTASVASSSAASGPPAPGALPSTSAPAAAAALPLPLPKQQRGRHASLSARIFGSFVGSSSPNGSSTPTSASASASHSYNGELARSPSSLSLSHSPPPLEPTVSPPSPVKPPTAVAAGKTRHARSGSVKSLRSVRSVSSMASAGGYGEWLWKAAGGWGGRGGGRATGSILEGREGHGDAEDGGAPEQEEEQTQAQGEAETPTQPSLPPTTPSRPSSSSSPRRARSPSSPSLSRTRSPVPPPPVLLSSPAAAAASTGVVAEGEMVAGGSRRGSKHTPEVAASDGETQKEGEEEGEERGMGTLRGAPSLVATAAAEASAPTPTSPAPLPPVDAPEEEEVRGPTFVPGIPLYSASSPPSPSGSPSPSLNRMPSPPTSSSSSSPADAAARLASQMARSAALPSSEGGGYVGSLSRALGLSSPPPARSGSGAKGLSAQGKKGEEGAEEEQARAEPNLTLFPRLPSLSLSRYALFAQPALSTPATHVSLTASFGTASALSAGGGAAAKTAGTGAGAGAGGGGTMELSTYAPATEAVPPSLALLKPSLPSSPTPSAAAEGKLGEAQQQQQQDEDDGPMIDRYGFIYDVRQGMELLRESRRREEGRKAGSGAGARGRKASARRKDKDAEPEFLPVPVPQVDPVLLTPPTEVEVHPQLDALREAIGLTPSTEEPPSALAPSSSPPPAPSAKLVRAPSSPSLPSLSHTATSTSTSTSPAPSVRSGSTGAGAGAGTGPQSMRALLVQLRTMTDAVEKTQQEAWDAFIRRRQAKLARLRRKEAAASAAAEGAEGKAKRERPKSVFLLDAPAAGGAEEAGEDEVWTSENLVGVAQMGTEGKGKKEDWSEFKELVRKGIPIAYRPKIWGECSSANEAREPGVYQELLAQPETEGEAQCLKQIDMDCHRTFPTNVFFAGNGPGVAKLRNVLVAYSRRNPKIGYCQGMNNLVATLLLTHPAEEDAFWVLVCIIENILPSDYYTSHLLVSRADQAVLSDLTARVLPKVADHLEEHGVELSAITFGWFLSLFTDVLPIQTLLRVWDLFFIHGTVLLFRISLAILKLHEPELLACDSAAALYALLGSLPSHLYHADKLLKVACEDLAAAVKDKEVSVLRSKHAKALQEEMGLSADEA